MREMYQMRFYSETKGNSSTSYEDDAYDGNVISVIMWKHTKKIFSKTCEFEAYDENVPNAILWKHKNSNFEIM